MSENRRGFFDSHCRRHDEVFTNVNGGRPEHINILNSTRSVRFQIIIEYYVGK